MTETGSQTIKVQCHVCTGKTNHQIKYTEVIREGSPSDPFAIQYELIRCAGCDSVSLRHIVALDSADDPDRIEFLYPPRTKRKKPDWLDQLDDINSDLKWLMEEVDVAVQGGAKRLTAMGIRAVFEKMFVEKVGDKGSFDANLLAFEEAKWISGTQREIIAVVIDVGSAAIHRSYLPSDSDIEAALGVMESLVKSIYIDAPAVQRIKLPPRPPRK